MSKDAAERHLEGHNLREEADRAWVRQQKHNGKANGRTNAEGAVLLHDLEGFIKRFVAYPDENAAIAHTLWIAHTHMMDAFESTPRIAFLSPEPESGKTRALEVTELLVPRPIEAVNVTAAYLFRVVGDRTGRPTILYDEIDTVFGPKAKNNEEIRGLLNAGHRRGAVAGRCTVKGRKIVTEEIPAYCAVALAGLGWLPDTIMSRSIVIGMRRRSPSEKVESFRRRTAEAEGHSLRDRLAGWAAASISSIEAARPVIPSDIRDRQADVWEPLLAIAEEAGGAWPERARVAVVTLVTLSMAKRESLGLRLLSDTRSVFGDKQVSSTKQLLTELINLEESPWGELKGKPLNERGLAVRLRQYEIKPRTVRIGESTCKGYMREDFADAWARYLPPLSSNVDP